MKKKVVILLFVVIFFPCKVNAQRGCCSHHGGVVGCSSSGRQICKDGTLSPTCTCSGSSNTNTKKAIYGCTDVTAFNYNSKATKDDGSCIAKRLGCLDKSAINYDKTANTNDNTCQYEKKKKEIESIFYDTEYRSEDKSNDVKEKVIQEGKNGKKEITYKIVVDQLGNVVSQEKISENVVEEPIKEIIETDTISLEKISDNVEDLIENTEEKSNDTFIGFCILAIFISFLCFRSYKNGKWILNKITNLKK